MEKGDKLILAMVNNKGVVGKTTTSVNLSAELANRGYRVLLIDLDRQGSASLSLGVARSDMKPSAADVLLEGVSIDQVFWQSGIENLDLLSGSMEMANADLILADVQGRENRLEHAIRNIIQEYEFIVVDCPPSLSLLSINALVAADAFMVPLVPQYLALEGLVNLLEAVDRIREGIGTKAELQRLLLTLVDYRTNVAREIVAKIRGTLQGSGFQERDSRQYPPGRSAEFWSDRI